MASQASSLKSPAGPHGQTDGSGAVKSLVTRHDHGSRRMRPTLHFLSIRDTVARRKFPERRSRLQRTLRIFHTADVHLGLKFGSYPEEVARTLSEARFETLQALVRTANDERCDLFVVSGDLFDHPRVAHRDILRAAGALGAFDRAVAVLPGNHDYVTGQEDDIWKIFGSAGQDRVRILTERRPYSLRSFDLDACLYPAPCESKHSKSHALAWMADSPRSTEQGRFRIGVAHGSFEALTPDTEGEYYPMTRDDLLGLGLDLWLMGHIHVQYPARVGVSDRIFYPSTPEPDGFDCRHEGKAWIIDLHLANEGDGAGLAMIEARSVATGRYRFAHETLRVESLEELEALRDRFHSESYRRVLLKLQLTGSLPREHLIRVAPVLAELQDRFLFLRPDHSLLTVRLSSEDVDREFTRGSFPHRLLGELARNPEDREALQAAYELILDSRGATAPGRGIPE